MKTIVAVCGHGLGSSFMVEMNIKAVLKEAGISGYSVSHESLTSFDNKCDILVTGKDLDDATKQYKGTKVLLNNLVSKDEMREKLLPVLSK